MQRLSDKHYRLPAHVLIEQVTDAHRRTVALVADLDDSQLACPCLETVNPFLWEIGHVGFFYEAFLLKILDGLEPVIENGNDLYNSFDVFHDERWSLQLPGRIETLEYLERTFEKVTARLNGAEPCAVTTYLYMMAVRHEDMHGEAFTIMRQALGYSRPRVGRLEAPTPTAADPLGDAEIPGGTFMLGASREEPFVYDNEKWEHPVDVEPFRIGRTPVTNIEYLEFIKDGGYSRKELWGLQGWNWREKTGALHPVHWSEEQQGWQQRAFDRWHAIAPHAPISQVSWYEAEAYCKWAGRRLPSELEWEVAASGQPNAAGTSLDTHKRRYPWGNSPPTSELAILDTNAPGAADVHACAAGDSAFGCRQMIGNVWEWTACAFYPFPGFVTDHPYKEYSAPWFGDRKVLKGGSWATRSRLANCCYRNFFPADRSDIFAGFRTCAI